MNEKNINMDGGSPEEERDGLTQEKRESAEYWLPRYEKSPEEERRDCEKEIAELQAKIDAFEAEHPLEELYAITDLTAQDAPQHPIREPARQALPPIVSLLRALEEETNITPERYDELKARCANLFKAVGGINNNKVKH